MTNFDKMKEMDVEELASLLDTREGKCEFCAWYVRETESLNCIDGQCDHGIKEWLEEEVN